MKKLFVLFILILIPFVSKADDSGMCGENLTWVYNSEQQSLTISGTGSMYDYSYTSSTHAPWYEYRKSILQLIIENGVTSIGNYAFYYCSGLTSITIPNSVTSIGDYAFFYCSGLTSITIPNSVTSIGDCAFFGCSGLTSITIPNSVTSIGDCAFEYCRGLTSITIPNSVTSIGGDAFRGCSGLTSITVSTGNPKYDSRNNCNAIIETSSNTLITGCKNTIIPNSVTSIGKYAFGECSGLTSITIPNSVTSIGDYAFFYCSGLTSITIPNSVTSIGDSAFSGCSGLTSITIPNSVTSIGNSAFSGCSALNSITIPNSVTSIGGGAFHGCSGLTSITVSTGNPKYDSRNNCNAIIETSSNTLITGCKNTIIPNSVTSIGKGAFRGCSGLTSITIPNSVTSIGGWAFDECSGLTSVISEIQYPFDIAQNVFSSDTYSKATLTVPAGTKSKYQSTNYWNKFTNIVESSGSGSTYITFADANVKAICVANWDTNGDGELSKQEAVAVTDIGTEFRNNKTITSFDEFQYFTGLNNIPSDAFSGSSGLTSITIPNSVTSIGNRAFEDCSGLTSITIPNSVTSVGNQAFKNCSGLTSITVSSGNTKYDSRNNCNAIIETSSNTLITGCKNTIIPNSVTSIGGSAFGGCSGLTSITIPNSVTSIGYGAFAYCSGLNSITIPNSVTSIGERAFILCSGLISITVSNGNNKYDSRNNCNAIIETSSNTLMSGCKNTIIPNSVTSIGDCAFYGCSGLTSITIPNSVTNLGGLAFYYCSSLESVISEIKNPFSITGDVFYNISSNATLQIPKGTKSKYEAFSGWTKYFKEIIESSTGTDSQIISFADANVKAICVANWDTNGDGELSEQEAAAVTDIGTTFISNRTITSFDEFQYFTGVDAIPNNAFDNCIGLTSITIPNSVTSIGNNAFWRCSGLSSITIPNNLMSIGNSAFYKCNGLTSIKIPSSVTSIGNSAFSGCSGLTSISIPNSVTSIGISAFADCSCLISIEVSSANTNYDSRNNCNAIIETSSNTLITGCKNTLIPNSVTSIGRTAFYGCSGLTSITIPNSVTSIGISSFAACSGLTSVTIPYSMMNIDASAFYGCSGLTSITIPNSVTSIGDWAFRDCSGLTSITIPNSVTNIGSSAFADCSGLISIEVSSANTNYDSRNNCNAIIETSSNTLITGCKNTLIPNSVKSIGNSAFSGCKGLTSITIPNSVTSIGSAAFENCSGLTSITIPNSITGVGSSVFLGCSGLTSITIPNSVTSIGDYAFGGCSGLTSITIPNSVTSIGSSAFSGCGNLKEVKSEIINPYNINYTVFSSISSEAILYVPTGTKKNYQACQGWTKYFKEIIEYSTETTTYSLSITASGDGYASYNGITIRNNTQSFAVNEGTNATVTFTPDTGYRVASVKNNNIVISPSYANNGYTVYNITANTTLTVTFEAIPTTTYSLSITASGNGSVSYSNTAIRNNTQSFTVDEGANATITFSPDNGYRLANVWVNNYNVTNSVYNNQYTINNIRANTTLSVEFEAIPVTTYSLSISASGNGYVSYNGSAIRNRTTSFTLDEGTSATVIFAPDNGNSISSVKLNNSDITSQISGNSYTVNNITANTTLSVTFQEDVNALTVNGVNYTVVSQADRTVKVTGGDFGQVLTVPATVTQNGKTWTVTGIDVNALKNNTELAAVIWNPTYNFTATVSNPNLLLYVKAEQFAPASIQNVVVNGTASNIVLAEAKSGNNFYCPQSFVAQKISFTHSYQMQTGIGEARGWETIALPFNVQTITHATKGEIKPFANWKSGDTAKPFWLMELTGTGFVETGSIKAYTPYIISMPNNPQYDNQWLLNGKVTFAASGVTVGKTEQLQEVTYKDRTFIPCYVEKGAAEGFYALNVSNDYETNNSGMTDGSRFVLNMRAVHPFEAYMTTASNAAPYIDVFDDMSTGIHLMVDGNWTKEEVVYDLQGRKLNAPLKKGVYIVNGKKKIIR